MSSFRSLSGIPSKYRPIFSSINHFNRVQLEVLDDVIKTKKHIVVSAPTGSGKTKIFELAIVELLMSLEHTNFEIQNVKIVYVAPTKALCNEIFHQWQAKFATFDLKVALATGDSDPVEMADLNDLRAYQIVVTTPEKWDAMTRKWKDYLEIANAVCLVLIDEVHLVGDSVRGPTLEAIVTRFKTFPHSRHIRFVSVSASLPNIEDVAKWLAAEHSVDSVRSFKIDEALRPVKLQLHVIGYAQTTNSFLFARMLTNELPKIVQNIISELSAEKQILIFCQSRNDVESTLAKLLQCVKLQINGNHRSALKPIANSIKDNLLRSSMEIGMAFHHAGLTFEDREHVENAYRSGLIAILLSTSTLAMGVNLPAHTVIIKSTESFINGSTREISHSMILQMMGRAGRQQYNTTGRVYIMTKKDKVQHYENFAADTTQIESHLNEKLAEFMNAEIVLNTITDTDASAMRWLRSTFLHARTSKMMTQNQADAKLNDWCKRTIQLLQSSGLVQCKAGGGLSPLPFGAVMAKYFLSITTMKAFHGFHGHETVKEILDKIVYCPEFSQFYLRKSEKNMLNEINSRIRYPGKILFVQQKVSCLIQAFLSHVPIESSALQMDMQKMVQIADRMVNSLIEYFQRDQFGRNCFPIVYNATVLAKSFNARTWFDSHIYTNCNLAEEDANSLIRCKINTIDELLQRNPRDIEYILKKKIPFGNELIGEMAEKVPWYKVNIDIMADNVICIRITQNNDRYKYKVGQDDALILLVGDSCNRLILNENIQPIMDECGYYDRTLSYSPSAHTGYAHVIHQSIIGADKSVRFALKAATKEERVIESEDSHSITMNKENNNTIAIVSDYQKRKKSSTASSKGSAKSRKTVNLANQPSVTQYFTKTANPPKISMQQSIRSVFDRKNTVEPVKNIIRSPDLFVTQTQVTQTPNKLYNFSNVSPVFDDITQSSERLAESLQINKQNDRLRGATVINSPFMAVTPIRPKLLDQRQANNSVNGFVCANAIFKKDVNNAHNGKIHATNQNKEQTSSTLSNDNSYCELDDDFLNMIFEEVNKSNSSKSIPHITSAKLACGNYVKKSDNKTFFINTMLNEKSQQRETVRNDFEECSESSSAEWEASHSTSYPANKMTKQQESFFSTDRPGPDLENELAVQKTLMQKGVTKTIQKRVVDTRTNSQSFLQASINSDQHATEQSEFLNLQPFNSRRSNSQYVSPSKEISSFSNRATCSSTQNGELSVMETMSTAPKTASVNNFNFVIPRQTQAPANGLNQINSQQRAEFLAPSSPERKKPKVINELMMKAKQNTNAYGPDGLRKSSLRPIMQPVEKFSSKNAILRLDRSVDKPEVDFDEIIRQRKVKLKIDVNYKQQDFDMDYIRYKILKIAPENPEKLPETSSVDPQPSCEESLWPDDDALFSFSNEFSFPDSNKYYNDESFADNLSEMNFVTDESRTSFFR